MKNFKHAVDFRNDDRVFQLMNTHGIQGYGFLIALYEELYKQHESGSQIQFTNIWAEKFARAIFANDSRTVNRILETLAEVRLINPQLWEEKIIFSEDVGIQVCGHTQKKEQDIIRQKRRRSKKNSEKKEESRVSHACVTRDIEHVTRDTCVTKMDEKQQNSSDSNFLNISHLKNNNYFSNYYSVLYAPQARIDNLPAQNQNLNTIPDPESARFFPKTASGSGGAQKFAEGKSVTASQTATNSDPENQEGDPTIEAQIISDSSCQNSGSGQEKFRAQNDSEIGTIMRKKKSKQTRQVADGFWEEFKQAWNSNKPEKWSGIPRQVGKGAQDSVLRYMDFEDWSESEFLENLKLALQWVRVSDDSWWKSKSFDIQTLTRISEGKQWLTRFADAARSANLNPEAVQQSGLSESEILRAKCESSSLVAAMRRYRQGGTEVKAEVTQIGR